MATGSGVRTEGHMKCYGRSQEAKVTWGGACGREKGSWSPPPFFFSIKLALGIGPEDPVGIVCMELRVKKGTAWARAWGGESLRRGWGSRQLCCWGVWS